MNADLLPEFIRTHYEVHEWKHVCAILKQDFVNEWNDIVSVLTVLRLLMLVFGISKSLYVEDD